MKLLTEFISKQVESIQNDFRSGSATIARNAVYILKNTVMSHGNEINKKDLIDLAKQLKNVKPSMAALQNIMQTCIYEIGLLNNITEFPAMTFKIFTTMNNAGEKCLNNTIKILQENNFKNIITCSFSNTILNLFEKLAESNYDFTAFIVESVYDKYNYGMQLFDKCIHSGIKTEYINIGDTEKTLNTIDCVVVGADRILHDGGAVNGTPSLFLAQKAQSAGKPFYITAESFKHSDILIVEKGFEFIGRKFITKIITNQIA